MLVRDIRVEPDAVFGVAVTYWRDRYGFRVQGALSRSSVTVGGDPLDAENPAREVLSADVNSWFYDVRGAIGLVKYSPTRKAWPYVFFGFGGITYSLDRTITPPLLTFVERGRTLPSGTRDIVIVEDDGRQFVLAIDELGLESVFAFSFGAGTDFRLPVGGGGVDRAGGLGPRRAVAARRPYPGIECRRRPHARRRGPLRHRSPPAGHSGTSRADRAMKGTRDNTWMRRWLASMSDGRPRPARGRSLVPFGADAEERQRDRHSAPDAQRAPPRTWLNVVRESFPHDV